MSAATITGLSGSELSTPAPVTDCTPPATTSTHRTPMVPFAETVTSVSSASSNRVALPEIGAVVAPVGAGVTSTSVGPTTVSIVYAPPNTSSAPNKDTSSVQPSKPVNVAFANVHVPES